MIDTTELGRATQMYQQYKARKAFAWLRVLGVLACLFVAAYGISRATVYVTEVRACSWLTSSQPGSQILHVV
jgi:hypothetical protein